MSEVGGTEVDGVPDTKVPGHAARGATDAWYGIAAVLN
jgi:hypothetical protein